MLGSPPPQLFGEYCHLLGPGGGVTVRKPLPGVRHLSILLEAVDIVPFSIFNLKMLV